MLIQKKLLPYNLHRIRQWAPREQGGRAALSHTLDKLDKTYGTLTNIIEREGKERERENERGMERERESEIE